MRVPRRYPTQKGIVNCSPIILGKSASGRLVPSSLIRSFSFLFTSDRSIHFSILLVTETVCFFAASHHHHHLSQSKGEYFFSSNPHHHLSSLPSLGFLLSSLYHLRLPFSHPELHCNRPQYQSLISGPRRKKHPKNILTRSSNRVYPPLALVTSTAAARQRGRLILFVTPLT